MKQNAYSAAITPAVFGIVTGFVLTTAFTGHTPSGQLYLTLPEYQLWRVVMIAQTSIYITVAVFLYASRREAELPVLPWGESVATGVLTTLVVLLPDFVERGRNLPLEGQRIRMLVIVFLALIAILFVTNRVARLFAGFGRVENAEEHVTLAKAARDLLMIAGLIVTLGTMGSGLIQASLAAMAEASPGYDPNLTREHVLAYGGYFTVALFLFFTPLLVAERRAAIRIAQATKQSPAEAMELRLGLNRSLTEHLVSAFGVLSPLLGAVATQLLP